MSTAEQYNFHQDQPTQKELAVLYAGLYSGVKRPGQWRLTEYEAPYQGVPALTTLQLIGDEAETILEDNLAHQVEVQVDDPEDISRLSARIDVHCIIRSFVNHWHARTHYKLVMAKDSVGDIVYSLAKTAPVFETHDEETAKEHLNSNDSPPGRPELLELHGKFFDSLNQITIEDRMRLQRLVTIIL